MTKVRLLKDLQVDEAYGMTKGRVLEALRIEPPHGEPLWYVQSDVADYVGVQFHEAVVVEEPPTAKVDELRTLPDLGSSIQEIVGLEVKSVRRTPMSLTIVFEDDVVLYAVPFGFRQHVKVERLPIEEEVHGTRSE